MLYAICPGHRHFINRAISMHIYYLCPILMLDLVCLIMKMYVFSTQTVALFYFLDLEFPLAPVFTLIWQQWSYLQVLEGLYIQNRRKIFGSFKCFSPQLSGYFKKVSLFASIQRAVSDPSHYSTGCFWSSFASSQLSIFTLWVLIEFKAHFMIRIQSNL